MQDANCEATNSLQIADFVGFYDMNKYRTFFFFPYRCKGVTFREFRVQLTQAAPVTMKNAFLLVGLEAGSLKKIEVRFPETGSVRIQVRFWIEFSDSTTRYKNHLIP